MECDVVLVAEVDEWTRSSQDDRMDSIFSRC